jgi:hypothetical protein
MKKEDISKFVDGVELIGGFNSDHIAKIKRVLRKIAERLTGKTMSTFSGGGCDHIFFQLEDLHWIGFHNSGGVDSTPSISTKPFKTAKSLETAFFEGDGDKASGKDFFTKKVTKAEFLDAEKVIIQWCKENNKDLSFLYPRGK